MKLTSVSHLWREITVVLLIKVVIILTIKYVWFSDRPHVSDEAVAARLLASNDIVAQQRNSHD